MFLFHSQSTCGELFCFCTWIMWDCLDGRSTHRGHYSLFSPLEMEWRNDAAGLKIQLFASCWLVVQSLSCVRLFTIPRTIACQASLSFTISWSLLKLISMESVMPSSHLILCSPLLLLPFLFCSIRVFSNESALYHRWPKYCSFSFSINPSNEYSGLASFRMDWFDLLVIRGTLDREGKELVKKGLEFASAWASGCLPGGSVVKNLPANAGDIGLIPGLGRSSGKGKGNPLQYCCLGNPTEIPQSLAGHSPWRHEVSDTWY